MTITKEPADILRKKLEAIEDIRDEIKQLAIDMKSTMIEAKGVGIAGNQVGKDMQIFLIDETLAQEHDVPEIWINPEITEYGKESSTMDEGCLSIPDYWVPIVRSKKIKIKAGKRVEEDDKIYPGYVLVDMIVDDDSWYVVRNTPRVTGFVGSGVHPVPLSKGELDVLLKRMESDTAKHKIELSIGDAVTIIDGPFKELDGKVAEVDEDRGKVKVLVSMFGRETPVELDFLQVKKI